MKTKIGIPFGLALVMFIGVFTTMLALGALNPQPAEAVGGDFEVTLSNAEPDSETSVSFTVTSALRFTGALTATLNSGTPKTTDTLTITFPADFTTNGAEVRVAGNWSLGGEDAKSVNAATNPTVVLTPADGIDIAAGEPISVAFTDVTTTATGIKTPEVVRGITPLSISVITSVETADDAAQTPAREVGASAGVSNTFNITGDNTVDSVTVTQDPTDPGAGARYQIIFTTAYQLSEGTDEIILDLDSAMGVPTSLSQQDVRISADGVEGPAGTTANQSRPLEDAPRYRVLAGTDNRKEYRISIPDMDASPDRNASIAANAVVTVTLQANAGFTNPTESATEWINVSTSRQTTPVRSDFFTPVVLFSDDKGDNRDKPLTVTGKGFKNGTSATVYLDKNKNGIKDDGDVDLVTVPVASDDTFEATFNVTVPPFEALPTLNVIGALDGEAPPNRLDWTVPADTPAPANETAAARVARLNADRVAKQDAASAAGSPLFEVEGLITVSPTTVGIGDTLTIDVKDWPDEAITKLVIGGIDHLGTRSLTVNNNSLQFDVTVDNAVSLGTQQVEIGSSSEVDNTNVVISGADLIITPVTAVPNQSISITGRGFSQGAMINSTNDTSFVTLGGSDDLLKRAAIYDSSTTPPTLTQTGPPAGRINGGSLISIDNGGNWSSSLIIPVTKSTANNTGAHELKVKDSQGREGVVIITLADRTLTLNPAASRVGTTVSISGTGFPARNSSDGASGVQVVQIEYNENGVFRTVASVTPDASGSFSTSFRVPLNAGIPSTNSVRAKFRYTEGTVDTGDIYTLTTHDIPEGTVVLDKTEVDAGTIVKLNGEGFKAYTTVTIIEVGDVEVTPSPRPSTGDNGAFTTEFQVPQLDLGIQNVSVKIGGTTASASLTIVEAATEPMMPGMMPGEAMAPAMAFAEVIAEDNLITVYHFDPATQSEAPNRGWTLYDARPLFMGGNNLDMIEPGGFYFVEVSENQMGVTIGGRTMDLYAGLNPIVW